MPPSTMMVSVAQAAVLDLITFAVSDVLLEKTWSKMDAVTAAYPTNETTLNVAYTKADPGEAAGNPFHGGKLAREAVMVILLNVMDYYWNIWLERTFPTRSKPFVRENSGSEKTDLDEQVEEEIVKKWIAQGKIKRASVNWGNTLIKWVLDLSIGLVVIDAARVLIGEVLHFRSPLLLHWHDKIVAEALMSWFSFYPLADLIGFVVVPAPKRIVFDAGAGLVWGVFIITFLGLFTPWIMKKAMEMEAAAANVTANSTGISGHEL